jgi:hypothetical protein
VFVGEAFGVVLQDSAAFGGWHARLSPAPPRP